MSFLSSLKLHNFRCYTQATLDDLSGGLVVLHGPNGAGKTNILEAVSLLTPGRGLRGARPMEVQCQRQQVSHQPWAVAADVQTAYGPVRMGTGLEPQTEKRIVRIGGETASNQGALAEHMACVWLTPQMDRLFLDSSEERRRFLDRLIVAFDPAHTGRLSRYRNAMGQRSKLLREGKGEPAWLEGLESQMAETGVAIAAARLDFMQRLQVACDNGGAETLFPHAQLKVKGTVESLLSGAPALEVEDMFRYQLAESRGVDMLTGGAATGPHKSDLSVVYAAKNMPAGQCSTGEQKALLIGIILAHARLITAERGHAPVLLLDEVAAHLDESRRGDLYTILEDLGGQVWLTGTDESLFSGIEARAQFFCIEGARIIPARGAQSPSLVHSSAL